MRSEGEEGQRTEAKEPSKKRKSKGKKFSKVL